MAWLVVEFFGPAREIAGVPEIELELENRATGRVVLQALAASYPAFLGTVIDAASGELSPYFLLNLDGLKLIKDLDAALPSGSRLLLLSAVKGG